MLARKTKLILDGWGIVGETPMLIPSFSSTINEDVRNVIKTMDEFIKGPILVSAYDIKFAKPKLPKLTFPTLIFIDSGGYECSIKMGVSDFGFYKGVPKNEEEWNETVHSEVINDLIEKYRKFKPLVIVSYDHPTRRESFQKQVKRARDLYNNKEDILKEFLVKPETKKAEGINIESLFENISLLDSFDIIGFTEKELGHSVWIRMTNIAKIRKEMDKQNIKKPVHIFGSLDTITTPLYYCSGADIFDGLTWIRYMFHEGMMLYPESHGPYLEGIQSDVDTLRLTNLAKNNIYLKGLEMDLEKFQSSESFDHFGVHADFFTKAYENLMVKLNEVK